MFVLNYVFVFSGHKRFQFFFLVQRISTRFHKHYNLQIFHNKIGNGPHKPERVRISRFSVLTDKCKVTF